MRGRMPRESNPLPNERPGYAPNFDTTGNEDYERVSPENPFPSANYIKQGNIWLPVSDDNPMPTQDDEVEQRLDAIENKLDSVIEDGKVNTQLAGSNVEYVISGVIEITPGSMVTFPIVDVSKFKNFTIGVSTNRRDVEPIGVRYRPYFGSQLGGNDYEVIIDDNLTMTGGNSWHGFVNKKHEVITSKIVPRIKNNNDETISFEVTILGFIR